MRNQIFGVFLIIALIVGFAYAASPADFYQWTTKDGVVSFTDNARKIPAAYKATAVERAYADLNVTKITPHNTSGDMIGLGIRLVDLRKANEPSAVVGKECEGHITVTSARMQIGDYNRRVFITRNECAGTVAVTPFSPHMHINR